MLKYFLLFAAFSLFPVIGHAQVPEDQTRDLWDTAFLQKRPAGKNQIKRTQPVRYKFVGKKTLTTPATQGGDAIIGVTIWRLRPSKPSDDAEVRQLIHQKGEWTPERVTAGTPLLEGSRVQNGRTKTRPKAI